MLDPDLLQTFVAIADTGSFTDAGRRVHRTQSAVSMQIKRLEEMLGRPLFQRDGRTVSLTHDGETLLGLARQGDAAGLKVALEGGGDISARDRWGQGLLFHAAARGAEDCIGLLLDRGAEVNAASDAGNSPLMAAAARGHVQAVRLLLGSGADPELRNKWGQGPHDWAQWSGATDEVRALLAGRLD